MGILRDLTAFGLLVHLVSLPTTSSEGDFKKILSNNVSIVLLDNNGGEIVNGTLDNVTSAIREYNNFSTIPETTTLTTTTSITTLVQDEKVLGDKLEKALGSVATADRVILISTSQAENSSKQILGPVILIESPSTSSQSSIVNKVNDRAIIDHASPIFDQEIAQSQTRTKIGPRGYVNNEDIENIEDLLAIAEYEPQKLDAKRIDGTNTQTSIVTAETNSHTQSTRHPLAEETHYDVLKRRNLPRASQRTNEYSGRSTTPKTTFQESSGQLIPASSNSLQISTKRRLPKLEVPEYNYKSEKRKSLSPTTFRQKSTDSYNETSRGPRHLQSFPSLMTNSPSTLVPGLPASIDGQFQYTKLKNDVIKNFTIIPESSRKDLYSFPPVTSRMPLQSTSETIPQKQIFSDRHKTINQPTFATLKESQTANRRIDDYFSPSYAKPVEHEIRPLSNDQQLGFLTRYNLPSLLTRGQTRSLSYPPVALPHRKQILSAEESKEKENDKTEHSSEKANPQNPKTNIPVYDYYEDSDEKSQSSQQVLRRPSSVGRSEEEMPIAEKTPIYHSYEDDEESKLSKIYHNINSPPTSITPAHERYDIYTKTDNPELASHRQSFIPRAEKLQSLMTNPYVSVPTRPIYHSYDYLGRTVSPATPINQLNPPIYSYQNGQINPTFVPPNNAYNRYKQYPEKVANQLSKSLVRPTVSYDSHDDSVETKITTKVNNEKIRVPNYVDSRYDDFKNVQTTHSPLANEENRNNDEREQNSNNYSVLSRNRYGTLSSTRVPYVNPQRASIPTHGISSPAHVKSSDTDSNEDDGERSYSSAPSKQRVGKRPHSERQNIRATNFVTEAPEYDSYDYNAQDDVEVSRPSTKTTSNEAKLVNYGNRMKSLLVAGHDENSSHHSRDRNEKRRMVTARMNEEPAESVQRADVVEDAKDYDDEEPASSGHEENHEKYETHEDTKKDAGGGGVDEKSEKGGGEKHEEGHHESENEKGEKGYKEWHEYDKGKKGHHDKENHEKEYDETEGDEKKHEDVSGYHKEHHHGEKGNKESEFAEKGEHQKGHSTKGQHVVHKKDEYEKKTEFYDESHEEDGNEKEGEYHYEHENKKGGHEKIGHHDSAHHEDNYGEKGEHEKGRHWDETKGHEDKDGREQDHRHEEKYGKKGGHEEGEKWSHKKGDNRKR